MNDQLPALVEAGQLATPDGATIVPALIANAGDRAGSRYVKFFTANNRNPHTRRAYARACGSFFAWCEERGVILPAIRPFDVAAWIDQLREKHRAPGVKQQLAAVRMLFDWFIAGQVVPINSAAAVHGPKYVVRTGKTPVLDAAEWRKLVDSIPTGTVRDLRDRALIATLTYSFARISAALGMKVEDLRPLITVWSEKGFCQRWGRAVASSPGRVQAPRRER
jgi:site-specific recombinase XerD